MCRGYMIQHCIWESSRCNCQTHYVPPFSQRKSGFRSSPNRQLLFSRNDPIHAGGMVPFNRSCIALQGLLICWARLPGKWVHKAAAHIRVESAREIKVCLFPLLLFALLPSFDCWAVTRLVRFHRLFYLAWFALVNSHTPFAPLSCSLAVAFSKFNQRDERIYRSVGYWLDFLHGAGGWGRVS